MKNLTLKTETIRVLSSTELDHVVGGVHKLSSVFRGGTANETHVSHKLSSVFRGGTVNETHVRQPHAPVSSVRP